MRRMTCVLVTGVLALAGCGGGGDEKSAQPASGDSSGSSSGGAAYGTSGSGSGGGEKLALAADPGGGLSFDKKDLQAKAGKVTIAFTNDSSTPHAVEIEGNGVEESSDTVTAGKASVTADLKAGEYTFYCPVGNHRGAGMEGTLTVK
jgi:plastocyanin